MLLMTMLAAWLTMMTTPDTPIGRSIRRGLVDIPAARLDAITLGHVAVAVLLAIVAGIALWVGEGDGARMLAMATPELATWLTTFEIATYLDIVIAGVAAWSTVRVRSPFARIAVPLRRAASRANRTRARRSRPVASNDDDEEHERRLAA